MDYLYFLWHHYFVRAKLNQDGDRYWWSDEYDWDMIVLFILVIAFIIFCIVMIALE